MRKLRVAGYVALILLMGIMFTFTNPHLAVAYTLPGGAAELNDPSLVMGSSGFKAKNIINTVLQVLGGVAVIMVIVGAIRITAAHGDPSQVKAGRETILYALVGVAVSMAAYAIINFVVSFNW